LRFRQSLKLASSWLAEVERAGAAVASFIVFAMMCMVFTDVIGRKLFNSPVQGAVEVSELALPAIVYLGVAYVQARREHIKLELFSSRFSRLATWLQDLFVTSLSLAICVIITVLIGRSAWVSVAIAEHTMGIVDIPVWPAKAAVFLGFLLLSVRIAIQLVEMCIDGRKAPDATDNVSVS